MWPDPEGRAEPRPHAYDLFEDGRPVGRLEWWLRPRRDVGWYLVRDAMPTRRLRVDSAIEDLARDTRTQDRTWSLHAELSAILSTALALDAAADVIQPRPEPVHGRFRPRLAAGRYEIHVVDLEPVVLAHAVPELSLSSVSNVNVLEGSLSSASLEGALRRVALLGGRVVAVFQSEEEA